MVITESDHDSVSKSMLPPDSASLTNSAANPDLPPVYRIAPSSPLMSPTHLQLSPKFGRGEPACRRLFKAFCVAITIWILLGLLIKSFGISYFADGTPSGPLITDGRVLSCANTTWDLHQSQDSISGPPPYTSTNSFYIPVSSSHIYIFSRGSYGHGTIKLEASDRSDGNVEVEIITRYHTIQARNHANVCHLEQDKHGQAIGLFTPWYNLNFLPFDRHIKFDVTVRFPRSGSIEPLIINSLQTKLGIWSHDITSLKNHVVFRSLTLSCSNAHIRADSVSAEFAQLKTSNGKITGSYNVSSSLKLKTSNAAIAVTLQMENKDDHQATKLEMVTSNGRIESPISLVSTNNITNSSPASFSVIASTSNGHITVNFPTAPSSSPFSHLNLDAKTSNAAVNIKLHPTYEGFISLRTSAVFTSSLVQNSDTKDPSGQGRHRNVDIRKVLKGILEAGVWWGDDANRDEEKGRVVASTSNAKNIVVLN